jgi:trk system potassium uptake protein TrkA
VKVVIVGAGEVGFHIASRLALENKDVVVIDSDPLALKRLSESIDVQTIAGSGSSPAVLEAASIREAEIMLAVTDSDEVNLVACLVADTLSPSTKKLARLRGPISTTTMMHSKPVRRISIRSSTPMSRWSGPSNG